jgi:glucokinase
LSSGTELILGLDVGGTKCVALLGNVRGEIIHRRQWASEAHKGAGHMLERIRRESAAIVADCGGRIGATGVAIGGPMDPVNGVVLSPPNLPGWDNVPLKQRLEEWLGVPARVEHDAAACALAEYLWGTWGRPGVLCYLTCGTGFGLGLVIDGKPFGGAKGRRPEVGHWRMMPEGPVAFGKSGSAEALCSGSGLSKLAAFLYPGRWQGAAPAGEELAQLREKGDADAAAVLRANATWTGRVCSMLADLLTPDVITLGSLSRYLGTQWLQDVRAEFERETEQTAKHLVRVEPASLGGRIGDLSALAAAVSAIERG